MVVSVIRNMCVYVCVCHQDKKSEKNEQVLLTYVCVCIYVCV